MTSERPRDWHEAFLIKNTLCLLVFHFSPVNIVAPANIRKHRRVVLLNHLEFIAQTEIP